ncbi:MAG: universal stress protein [Gammaproteobacteria bacterium]
MYQTILLCYDGTREGRAAVRQGAELAMKLGAQTHMLAVMQTPVGAYMTEAISDSYFEREQQAAQQLLDEAVRWLNERGLQTQGHLVFGNPADQIPQMATALAADLVVVGHHRRSSLARWWAGPENASLLDRVPCSLLIAILPG